MPRRPPKDRPDGKAPRSFRITPEARTIDYAWLHGLTEETSYDFCQKIRFRENKGEPFCPRCGSTRAYKMATRKGYWSCGDCRKQYSVTSGTIFHSRKLPFLKLVKTVYAFADCAKGTSACELGLKQDLDYKTIWVLLMKIREAMASRRNNSWLLGTVELSHPQSRNLKGYWQNHELPKEQQKRGEVRWERVHKRVRPMKPKRAGSVSPQPTDGDTGD